MASFQAPDSPDEEFVDSVAVHIWNQDRRRALWLVVATVVAMGVGYGVCMAIPLVISVLPADALILSFQVGVLLVPVLLCLIAAVPFSFSIRSDSPEVSRHRRHFR